MSTLALPGAEAVAESFAVGAASITDGSLELDFASEDASAAIGVAVATADSVLPASAAAGVDAAAAAVDSFDAGAESTTAAGLAASDGGAIVVFDASEATGIAGSICAGEVAAGSEAVAAAAVAAALTTVGSPAFRSGCSSALRSLASLSGVASAAALSALLSAAAG